MSRVMHFIDGFNVYWSLKENSNYHKYLWLDYMELAKHFNRKKDIIAGVKYFTAFRYFKPESVRRHERYAEALESRGVEIIAGKFKDKDRRCKLCYRSAIYKEEKQTDVNIASKLFQEGIADTYDTAILYTNDTDLIPAIVGARDSFQNKKFGIVFPIGRFAHELYTVAQSRGIFWRRVEEKHLRRSQLPDQITMPNGVEVNGVSSRLSHFPQLGKPGSEHPPSHEATAASFKNHLDLDYVLRLGNRPSSSSLFPPPCDVL